MLARFDPVPCRVEARLDRFRVAARGPRGESLVLHNTNTGRLLDVLVPGVRCLAYPIRGPRLRLRLAAVEYHGGLAVVDTVLQARAFEAAVEGGLLPWARGCRLLGRHPRVPVGRLDYRLDCGGSEVLVETKSAVLAGPRGEALYPDTVSLRGRRHVSWMMEAHRRGRRVMLVFIAAFPAARCYAANPDGDPALASLIWEARQLGVPMAAISLEATTAGEVRLVNPSLPPCPGPWTRGP
ncbi:MAG: DNA/RNA nuclease SfsA, partial [Desulfurococcales archaeon]|nr:DNA/RNA nuclease SfsA [Desulfurococcales archaeon]